MKIINMFRVGTPPSQHLFPNPNPNPNPNHNPNHNPNPNPNPNPCDNRSFNDLIFLQINVSNDLTMNLLSLPQELIN